MMSMSEEDRPKYDISIEQAQGPVIGDYAHVEQHFYPGPPPPSVSRDKLLAAVHQASAELRTYSSEIAGVHIERPEVDQIVDWVLNAKPHERLGMLLDQPGGGKTVVMRDVLERLEATNTPVLAIKADALSGVKTRVDLADRLGLPVLVEKCAHQLGVEGLFVVLLDQLDALSLTLSRGQAILDVMLSTLAHLRDFDNVRIVASCRTFDLKNDPHLSTIKVDREFQLQPLDDSQVNRVLQVIGIDAAHLLPAHQALLRVPLHLSIYAQVIASGAPKQPPESFHTLQELYKALWQKRVVIAPPDTPPPPARITAIYRLVEAMQNNHQLTAPEAVLDEHPEAANYLERVGFIRREGSNWIFFHPTLFDYCYARRFVAQDRSLSQEILSGSQGLFERSQMVQVLAYLRGLNETKYRRELTTLLFTADLRVHLRLLLIGWFGSLTNPTADELRIARRLMKDSDGRAHFLHAVGGNESWFDLLNSDVVPTLLRAGDAELNRTVIPYLGTLIQCCPNTVLAHLRPHLGSSEVWDARIAFCLSRLDDWQSDEALDVLCDLLRRGRAAGWEGHFLYRLAQSNPAGGCMALQAYLGHRLDELLEKERAEHQNTNTGHDAGSRMNLSKRLSWDQQLLGEYAIGRVMEQAVQVCPEKIIEHLLPWFVRAVVILTEPGDRELYPLDPLFAWGWYGEHISEGAAFARWMAASLQHLAQTSPVEFRAIAATLATIESLAIQRVLAHAYLSAPEVYANDILDYLTADMRRLNIGETSGSYDSCQLYGAAFRCLDTEHQAVLERLILDLQQARGQYGHRYRDLDQLRFFKSVPSDLLSKSAYRRLQELERKFPGFELQSPKGTEVHEVGPPIEPAAQVKMSDEAWLGAMRKYDNATARGAPREDFLKGGVVELSRAFAEQVKKDPERFYRLTQRFDETISSYYIEAAISGLAESKAPAEWVFDLGQKFAPCIEDEFRRGVCRALAKRAEAGVPDDLLDVMTDWALHDPDPAKELWRISAGSGQPYYSGDPFSHGINTNRGAAVQAVCHCALLRKPPQVERVFKLLEQTADDPSTAVRACVIDSLGSLLRENDTRTLDIFERAMDGHSRLLQSPLVHRFLYWTYYHRFSRICPFIETLLSDTDDATRRAGARLACLAAFRHPEASTLADQAVYGDVAMREGAVEVYARNLEHLDLEAVCQKHLLQFVHDPDEQVRAHVGDCFIYLGPEHLDHLRPFIEELLGSPALLAGAEHFVKYLKQLAIDEHDLALRVTARIIDVVGNEIIDMRTSRALLEPDLVHLPLIVYNHADDQATKSRAMDIFERLLLLGSRTAKQALVEWDRR